MSRSASLAHDRPGRRRCRPSPFPTSVSPLRTLHRRLRGLFVASCHASALSLLPWIGVAAWDAWAAPGLLHRLMDSTSLRLLMLAAVTVAPLVALVYLLVSLAVGYRFRRPEWLAGTMALVLCGIAVVALHGETSPCDSAGAAGCAAAAAVAATAAAVDQWLVIDAQLLAGAVLVAAVLWFSNWRRRRHRERQRREHALASRAMESQAAETRPEAGRGGIRVGSGTAGVPRHW